MGYFMRLKIIVALIVICQLFVGVASFSLAKQTGGIKKMKLTSSAFKQGESVPAKYSCDGDDVSPPLAWGGVPANTKSFALIVDDPDAPAGTWIHWTLFNIPPSAKVLPEGIRKMAQLSDGSIQGMTSHGSVGYEGPCPPSGTHRYYFTLYALDCLLNLDQSATKDVILNAIKGHVLAEGQLMGTYSH